ncbi:MULTISPECIES: elongation factor P hydroxylase [Pseudoalteromonas]|uniref:Elongation factor P hydroxylase n=1 Tax=Pseudoalteromonas peptidolytica F12-50-A1 TaxID=1315280 RepID=A0A8I0MYY8_9GAMM|nr:MULTISPECIES: elongation factor P hydroxylase [Pseudoalteromonas]MBE0348500.1 hypothetical protein [Pseudoalteromonas peptidolytica F12-50-A1]NLR16743.1 elongation factor P hydroxylase [Pseudoalteromonas peptidolytica]RXE99050.1 elongation factor P hydroxylase [Pseudoalteromonas sp. PS5]GEK11251.1 elongation factor P hydroxylase [Pseudoalteromonas peptidolytica]
MHKIEDLIAVFNGLFLAPLNTELVAGLEEPIYLPASEAYPHHRIIFAHGFYASALHEIAHWLVAGKARRELEDYGYWYCPDGRDETKQREFEHVEVKPQAIEWALSAAANFSFNVSVDNLSGAQTCRFNFQKRVHQQLISLLDIGFNERATCLLEALSQFYNTPWPLNKSQFNWNIPSDLSVGIENEI